MVKSSKVLSIVNLKGCKISDNNLNSLKTAKLSVVKTVSILLPDGESVQLNELESSLVKKVKPQRKAAK